MTEREDKAHAIFLEAVGIADEAERSVFLDQVCGGDQELRRRVEQLLQSARQAGSFLEHSPAEHLLAEAAERGPDGQQEAARFDQPTLDSDFRAAAEKTDGASSDRAARPGTRVRYVGDYELLEEIGRGGMGVVYKARQVSLDRTVAVKMIAAGQLASDADLARFRAEAQAAAQLQHPNIVAIHEVGQHEGQPYFSMDLVEGASLADIVRDKPLAPRQAAQYVKAVAEAIALAHQHGVIHRDLKPANILIDRDGPPKVTDFGLAKRMETESGLTGSGQILGTPEFMAPEQASGKPGRIGPAADIYALGAVFYTLLTGRPPFQAATPLDTILQVLNDEPVAPRQLNRSIPRDLETICLKCLEKEPRQRYQTAQELADDLGRFLADEPIFARPVGPAARLWRWCRRNRAIAALLAVCLLILVAGVAGIAWQWMRAERLLAQLRTDLSVTIKDSQSGTRAKVVAARTLWRIDQQAHEVLPTLIEALHTPDKMVRDKAAGVLGEMGSAARPALPALIEAAKDPPALDCSELREGRRYWFRGHAEWAIARIGVDQRLRPSLLQALGECVEDDNPYNNDQFMELLSIIDADPTVGIPRHIRDIRTDGTGGRVWAYEALMRLGPEDKSALDPLTHGLQDNSPQVRRWCAAGLIKLGPAAGPAVGSLVKALDDPDQGVRWRAAIALGTCGTRAPDAVAALRNAARDSEIASAARWALSRIQETTTPTSAQALPPPVKRTRTFQELWDPVFDWGDSASNAELKARLLDYLSAMLDKRRADRRMFLYGLSRDSLGPVIARVPEPSRSVSAALIELLRDENPDLRELGVETLLEVMPVVGSDAAEAVPSLIVALQDPHPSVAAKASLALAAIGDEAIGAAPGLQELIESVDEHPAVSRFLRLRIPVAAQRVDQPRENVAHAARIGLAVLERRHDDALAAVEKLLQPGAASQNSEINKYLAILGLEILLEADPASMPVSARVRVVENLSGAIPDSPEARTHWGRALMHALDDAASEVRAQAIAELTQHEGASPVTSSIVQKLRQLHRADPNAEVRELAGQELQRLGIPQRN